MLGSEPAWAGTLLNGWSCQGMGSGRTIPPLASCPSCPARWVTLGLLHNLSGPLKKINAP